MPNVLPRCGPEMIDKLGGGPAVYSEPMRPVAIRPAQRARSPRASSPVEPGGAFATRPDPAAAGWRSRSPTRSGPWCAEFLREAFLEHRVQEVAR